VKTYINRCKTESWKGVRNRADWEKAIKETNVRIVDSSAIEEEEEEGGGGG